MKKIICTLVLTLSVLAPMAHATPTDELGNAANTLQNILTNSPNLNANVAAQVSDALVHIQRQLGYVFSCEQLPVCSTHASGSTIYVNKGADDIATVYDHDSALSIIGKYRAAGLCR